MHLDPNCDDADLVRRALERDDTAFHTITQRYSRRLYRIARSILRNDSEAEDAVQEAYLHAFTHLENFRSESSLSTWLSRIVMNEALERLRRQQPTGDSAAAESGLTGVEVIQFPLVPTAPSPEHVLAQREILHLVAVAIDHLPDKYRIVFVTRVIEGMTVAETADLLGLRTETVKIRLHRARRLLRDQLDRQIGSVVLDAFPFDGHRCARMTEAVITRLGLPK